MTDPATPLTPEYVDLPVLQADRREVARRLLDAADDQLVVRSTSEGFHVPYTLAKSAGLLDEIARPALADQVRTATDVKSRDAALAEAAAAAEAERLAAELAAAGEAGAVITEDGVEHEGIVPAEAATETEAETEAETTTRRRRTGTQA